ncbi:xanthine dehydrogenase family protein molybdopterin-binding subunit [Alsobacter sp. SYSU M60028]|uniref:Xanthine dehydrogenase family protein molybdopterin-binding subunit n=1 Tax=Alsobacter ponti TaxID=2962936 RepID=A0ABT1LA49_9HYPH|nr:xanthine dehydrogenase family protein molybdopterin-binding subunit [Alsobacter ponti]MCP8938319.1 xanthine dehydrogenase family protein molybdopterin-binding subunit [Alsobacter ponti]
MDRRRERSEADAVASPADDPRSLRRREDARFLRGEGHFLDDIPADGQLVGVVLRSPHAHADILSIDASEALVTPGVRAVLTGRDLVADGLRPLPCSAALAPGDGFVVPPRWPLCCDRVRHVGDPVAFVVAEDRAAALDALERIEVSYAERDAAVGARAALAPGAPALWDEAPGNLAFHFRRGDADAVARAMRSAAHIVSLDLVNSRVAAAALEPRGAIGSWDAEAGRWRLELSGASVHQIRREMAQTLGVAPELIDVVCHDVGGGFGMKNVSYPEYALTLWAARRLGAPVRWIAERVEDFTGGAHGRDNLTTARLALDEDGRFLAFSVETLADLGAYASSLGPGPATTAALPAMGGLYDIPAVAMDVRGAYTNSAPVDAYRGAGKPEANYAIERLVDIAARRLGRDPAELRRRNLIRATPHVTAMGARLDSGDFAGALDAALAAADRDGFPARREAAARRGLLRGLGVACFLETSRGPPGEEAWARLLPDGSIELAVGTQSNGQGHETSFVQLAASRLGLPMEAFRYVQADTSRVPRGGGHGGARSLHMGGTALLLAVDDLLDKAGAAAAPLLQAGGDKLAFEGGTFHREGAPAGAASLTLAALARALPDAALEGHGAHAIDLYTFPSGCHVAEVEIDPATGVANLVSYLAVDDFGAMVNPLLTEGQVQGGLAQGIGQALMEQIVYEPDSGQALTATWMDYAMPRAADLPRLEVRFRGAPTASNPIGAKGAGQAGAIAATPTVINAIVDALAPLGVLHVDMPATPEKLWRAIRDAGGVQRPPRSRPTTPVGKK